MNDQDNIQCPRCKDKVKIENVAKHLESCEKFGKFIETMAAFQCSLCAAENREIRFFNTEDMFKHFTAEHSVFCHFLSKLSNRPNQNPGDQQGQGMVDKKHIFFNDSFLVSWQTFPRGHSTNTWTEFCHSLPPSPA